MKMPAWLLIGTAGLAFLVLPAHAATIRVPDDEPTIQAGIDTAATGDTVMVACGTYYEHNLSMPVGICVTSETGQSDCVTIDAGGLGRVMDCQNVSDLVTIWGITFTGGFEHHGGALLVFESTLDVVDCVFTENEAEEQGGAASIHNCSPSFARCVFEGNTAGRSGAVRCTYSSPSFSDCIFRSNEGGIVGSLLLDHSQSVLEHCEFTHNSASGGVGVAWVYQSSPTLRNCTFSHNIGSDGTFYNGENSSAVMVNCVVAFSPDGRGILCYDSQTAPTMVCCNVYGNAGGDWIHCIADQFGILGNISEDPLFCDPIGGDFGIDDASPCAPGNNSCGVLMGAYGIACGASQVEEMRWGTIKAMFR